MSILACGQFLLAGIERNRMPKTLLTIGTNPGIGVATAIRFAREGYRIVVVSDSARDGNAAVAHITGAIRGAEVLMATADLADPVQVANLVLCFGSEIDVLQYHAADVSADDPPQPVGAQPADAVDVDICRHVTSMLATVHAVMPMMRMRGAGSILLSTSHLAALPDATRLTLSIGSAAVRTVVDALFEPLRQLGVHIAALNASAGAGPDTAEIAEQFWRLHSAPSRLR
jgi:NAD(P)-dependent dehydrogenase (short-subunit alcohol dehydrogenase family)